jgi:hypothetical protein
MGNSNNIRYYIKLKCPVMVYQLSLENSTIEDRRQEIK